MIEQKVKSMHNARCTIAPGGANVFAARAEAHTPYALASFVNGKFNSAGVEGFCEHNYPER